MIDAECPWCHDQGPHPVTDDHETSVDAVCTECGQVFIVQIGEKMLTSREAQTVQVGDTLVTTDGHQGQVLSAPERTNSTYGEVRLTMRCDAHQIEAEEVRLPANKLVSVDRNVA